MDLSKVNLSRFEAQQCCVQNHGFLAEPASQEEHDLIKQHLVISKISHCHNIFNIYSINIIFIICLTNIGQPGRTPTSLITMMMT